MAMPPLRRDPSSSAPHASWAPLLLVALLGLLSLVALVGILPIPAAAHIVGAQVWPPGGFAKDFAMVKRNGVFHIFHIHSFWTGVDGNYFAHRTSTDMYHWSVQPSVMVGTQSYSSEPDGRNGWNRDQIWAPSIVQHRGVYYMFYTGARQRPDWQNCPGSLYQKTGVATSTDLWNWNLDLDPWIAPNDVPWTLPDSCSYNYGNFRDPFVMQDPVSGEWLMYYVTIPNQAAIDANIPCEGDCNDWGNVRYVVALSGARADFVSGKDWFDRGALWLTHAFHPLGENLVAWESPHLFAQKRDEQTRWYLMASTGTDIYAEQVTVMTSDVSPVAPPEDWVPRGTIADLDIRDSAGNSLWPQAWFATEYFRDPEDGREYLANCVGGPIEIRRIRWKTNEWGFLLEPPYRVDRITPTPTTVASGDSVLFLFRSSGAVDEHGAHKVGIEAIQVDHQGNTLGVIPSAEIGLPDSLLLTSDQTALIWPSREWQGGALLRMRLRLKDISTDVRSATVTVHPGNQHDGSVTDDRQQPVSPGETAASPPPLALRSLGRTPLGAGEGVLVEMPAASPARLELFDLRGARVRTLIERELPVGATVVRWDGRDTGGRAVAPGVYLARLTTPSGVRSARVVLLRR